MACIASTGENHTLIDNESVTESFSAEPGRYEEYLRAASAGDGEAMRHVAECIMMGCGGDAAASGKSNAREAWRWYGKAARTGDLESEYFLGVMYRDGIGVSRNSKEAAYWFRKAASNGHGAAMLNIARMFEQGDGVLQDYRVAAENYWRAAERGLPEAAYRYAVMCRDGIGVKADRARARRYFLQAAESGFADSAEQAALLR